MLRYGCQKGQLKREQLYALENYVVSPPIYPKLQHYQQMLGSWDFPLKSVD